MTVGSLTISRWGVATVPDMRSVSEAHMTKNSAPISKMPEDHVLRDAQPPCHLKKYAPAAPRLHYVEALMTSIPERDRISLEFVRLRSGIIQPVWPHDHLKRMANTAGDSSVGVAQQSQ